MKYTTVIFHFSIAILLFSLIACTPQSSPVITENPISEEELVIPVTGGDPTPPPAEPVEDDSAIQHQSVPGELPEERVNQVGDHDASNTQTQRRAEAGDRFTLGRFERPFNAHIMDVYFPYLDIWDAHFYLDETWIYAVINLIGTDKAGGLPGRYAFEIDVDQDGGGDWLVMVIEPLSNEWSTNGVQVWFDSDNDVGGAKPVTADLQPESNGYETLLFDQDEGEDPDLAWARITVQGTNTVQRIKG